MREAIFHFATDGAPVDCRELSGGHINRSYLVGTDAGARYVLQRVNTAVFPDVRAVMGNAARIGEWMARRPDALPAAVRYLPATDGAPWYEDAAGNCWRCYRYVENSVCLPQPETLSDLEQGGVAFGRFLHALRDFPAEELEETIPRFHDTPDRYRRLREAAERDRCGRVRAAGPELRRAFALKAAACRLHALRESGALPLRVTHNDAKFGNVLLDRDTRRALCVIDLDTVMPGLAAYDFGDGIRSGASVGGADEPLGLDLERFEAFTRGFLAGCPTLTGAELRSLPLGALAITAELGVRFLTDWLDGDRYFRADDTEQNLRRARRHLLLAEELERRQEELDAAVLRLAGR